MIQAEIIADSVSEADVRITTFLLTYPRFIHSELMTHRVFSRNSASSRAIPIKKMLESIVETPALPIFWGKHQRGMQSDEQVTGWRLRAVKFMWFIHRWYSLACVYLLNKLGLHKQLANRLLESHAHITVLVTSTQWANFFHLRAHKDAQPEFKDLAEKMLHWYNASRPKRVVANSWHLPFITNDDFSDEFVLTEIKQLHMKLRLISTARCARVSYTLFNHSRRSCEDDYKLGLRLTTGDPLHASPMEHQATPDPFEQGRHLWGNFHGWIQHRKLYPTEALHEYTQAPVVNGNGGLTTN